MHLPIFLLTDFGHQDPYVGIMKAVALRLGYCGLMVDLAHDLPPQDVVAGALALQDSFPWLPEDCVVCAVVDPGVGTGRRHLAVRFGGRTIIAPDNGLLTPLLLEEPDHEARQIKAWGPIVPARSATFHGRDVFMPAAVVLANWSRAFGELGPIVEDPELMDLPGIEVQNDDSIGVTILTADHFGNMATNLRRVGVPEGCDLDQGRFYLQDLDLGPLRTTFADVRPGQPLVYFNSADRLEIAVCEGNAAEFLEAAPGDMILFVPDS